MSRAVPWPDASAIRPHVSADAVVVVPGVMGSELVDAATGDILWGFRSLRWYAQAWTHGRGLDPLAVTEDERAGKLGRVKASRLLRFPAFMPVLAGLEPYTRLTQAIRQVVAHPGAVGEFGYDWRLPVAHNARLLADFADRHLREWRARADRPEARLVLVAHSMGGLLCRAMAAIPGAADDVRATVTLGTPFDGAAKTAMLLATGHGTVLPAGRLRPVTATMPGLYDLLPSYRCVHEQVTVRALTPHDVQRFTEDDTLATSMRELSNAAFDQHATLAHTPVPGHWALIGVQQPTVSSLTIDNGVPTGQPYTFTVGSDGELECDPGTGLLLRTPGLGDGTVPAHAALPYLGVQPMPLAQQHGAIARSPEAIAVVCHVIQHGSAALRPRLGAGDIGLAMPDIVAPGVEWTAMITGIASHEARCVVTDAETHQPVDHPMLRQRDEHTVICTTVPEPGLYRVEVTGGGTGPVTQLVLAREHADAT